MWCWECFLGVVVPPGVVIISASGVVVGVAGVVVNSLLVLLVMDSVK